MFFKKIDGLIVIVRAGHDIPGKRPAAFRLQSADALRQQAEQRIADPDVKAALRAVVAEPRALPAGHRDDGYRSAADQRLPAAGQLLRLRRGERDSLFRAAGRDLPRERRRRMDRAVKRGDIGEVEAVEAVQISAPRRFGQRFNAVEQMLLTVGGEPDFHIVCHKKSLPFCAGLSAVELHRHII